MLHWACSSHNNYGLFKDGKIISLFIGHDNRLIKVTAETWDHRQIAAIRA